MKIYIDPIMGDEGTGVGEATVLAMKRIIKRGGRFDSAELHREMYLSP